MSPPAQLPHALPPPQYLGSKQSLAGDTPGQPEAWVGLEACLSSLGLVVWVRTQDSLSRGPQWDELWRAPLALDSLQTLIPSASGIPSLRSLVQTRASRGQWFEGNGLRYQNCLCCFPLENRRKGLSPGWVFESGLSCKNSQTCIRLTKVVLLPLRPCQPQRSIFDPAGGFGPSP